MTSSLTDRVAALEAHAYRERHRVNSLVSQGGRPTTSLEYRVEKLETVAAQADGICDQLAALTSVVNGLDQDVKDLQALRKNDVLAAQEFRHNMSEQFDRLEGKLDQVLALLQKKSAE